MTGITQIPERNTSPRPDAGRRSMQAEEVAIRRRLNECEVEAFVEEHWSKLSPQVIAALLYARYPRALPWITPRWIESIHRRLTNRKRP